MAKEVPDSSGSLVGGTRRLGGSAYPPAEPGTGREGRRSENGIPGRSRDRLAQWLDLFRDLACDRQLELPFCREDDGFFLDEQEAIPYCRQC